MPMNEFGLFITHDTFKEYSSKMKLSFIRKLKRHRLMSRQAKAWGYGENYLSQVYFSLKKEEKEGKAKKRAKQQEKLPRKQVKTEKKLEVKKETPQKADSQVAETESNMRISQLQIVGTSIEPDLALEVVNYFKEKFKMSSLEINLTDSTQGYDLHFTAKEERQSV